MHNTGLQQKISESDLSTPCMQPKAVGSCSASIPSYFFNAQTGKCTPFNYGGCGGNDNRFKSYHECDFKCNRIEQAPLTRPQFANSTTNNMSVAISAAGIDGEITMFIFRDINDFRFLISSLQ